MTTPRYQNYTVFNELKNDADIVAAGDFGDEISAVRWRRDSYAHSRYDNPDHHTLSLYLTGGTGILREQGTVPLSGGGPGRVCVMPAHISSDWMVRGQVELFHLYIPVAAWDRAVVEVLDTDPARIELTEKTFWVDPAVEQMVRNVIVPLDWNAPADRLVMSSAGYGLLHHLLSNYTVQKPAVNGIRGGLSGAVRRRVIDYVSANLEQAITLDDLASVAGLSVFHFSRMFRTSLGEAPHQYVLRKRISQARSMLHDGDLALAEIAMACGFSSQAHLTTRFGHIVGVSPARYRQIVLDHAAMGHDVTAAPLWRFLPR
ncbi:helix-turn-helix domain-containing protein [Thalassospira marina]|uniref:AraC family transcriptional regulator n=1 Tax=Thalassospira marina TaxID=2048283 RepID=A0A2N3KXE9_9PROT|nr:AraC family transcriptional regulator [Thalassospira marina]PKR55244.1 AraC family transcriptional regulator [Thalassospira marina]